MLNQEEFLGQRMSPQGWEQRKLHILRKAREARARQVRGLARAILSPVRAVALAGRRLAWLIAARIAAAASRGGRAYATWRLRRQAIAELGGLDDRALKDFGISRSEIEVGGLWPPCGRGGRGQDRGTAVPHAVRPPDHRQDARDRAAGQEKRRIAPARHQTSPQVGARRPAVTSPVQTRKSWLRRPTRRIRESVQSTDSSKLARNGCAG